jgi:hydrogenase-4 component F
VVLAALVLIPLAASAAAFLLRANGLRRGLLLAASLAHAALTAASWITPPAPAFHGNLALDPLGQLFLTLISLVFLAAAFYGVNYLGGEEAGPRQDFQGQGLFLNAPEARFTACLLLFLASMTLTVLAQNLALVWVGVEATTLASAPLIYFHRHSRSLEAAWKYLMVCSVGIALALIGNILLSAAQPGGASSMLLSELIRSAPAMRQPWLKAAFVFTLVGYGTKMGLAPMHTWLPDAHSEAPSMGSALFSGILLNCAFLGILRVYQVALSAGLASFCQELFLAFGLFSMGLAAVFIVGQGDYKRMLAYSSVEHMGLLVLGLGLGGGAVFGSMLHAVNHSLAKSMLFLLSGNILAVYHSKSTYDVRGVTRALPATGWLWLLGFLAITGTPPFGAFVSEFTILRQAFAAGRFGVAATALVFLALIFIGMSVSVLRMAQGTVPPDAQRRLRPEPALSLISPLVLGLAALALGLVIPETLRQLLQQAAAALGS